MVMGCKLDYYIIYVFFLEVATKKNWDYIYFKK